MRHPNGAWLCELAALADEGPVSHAVAAALRVQQRHGSTIGQNVLEYLRDRELLLVLDNCEHVLGQVAELVGQVVRQCPAVTVLATSRERLGVEGERILPVDPLPADEATALFADRARAMRPASTTSTVRRRAPSRRSAEDGSTDYRWGLSWQRPGCGS